MVQWAGDAEGMGKAKKKDVSKGVSGSTWNKVKQRIKMLSGENAGGKARSGQEVSDVDRSQGKGGAPTKSTKRGIEQRKRRDKEEESGQSSGSRETGRKRKASSRNQEGDEQGQTPTEDQGADETDTDQAEYVESEKLYEVQAIRKKRCRQGNVEFLVKWLGWPERDNTWEPYDHVAHVLEHCTRKPGARKRGGQKMKTYKSRKPRKSSTSCRNSTEASNHSVTVTEPGVAYTALNAQHASPPKRAGGSFKRPTITAIEDRKSDDTDEDVRISEARTDGRTSTELLESSFHPQSSSNPDEDTAHTLLDTEVSGGGSDIVNGDANILVAPATIKPVSDLMVTSDPELEKCLDANRSPKHDQQAFEKRGLDSSPESVSQVVQEEGPVGGGAKAAVGAAQPAREVDPGVREGEILDDEFPAPSRGPPQGCDGTSEFSGSTQADEWTVTEHRAEEREIEAPAAKRRKCGNVKRVRVCADTSDDNPPLLEDVERQVPKPVKSESLRVVGTGAVESTPGDIRRSDQQGGGLSSRPTPSTQGADSSVPVSAGTTADKPPHVKRIIKAISYNQTVINGKQEVVVIFRALSSDGQEVFVNNTDLRNKYPLLLHFLPTMGMPTQQMQAVQM